MNILYCGDKNIEDGLLVSIISLTKQVKEPLHIYVLTMSLEWNGKSYEPVSEQTIAFLDDYVKNADAEIAARANTAYERKSAAKQQSRQNDEALKSFVKRMDITDLFNRERSPDINMGTRFTPYCMLRLYADEVKELPDRLLYLDNDVICRRDIGPFYHQNLDGIEFAGVLDYYGGWFFRRNPLRRDYVNSGVLLLNMQMVRGTGLFRKCRERCRAKKMFMPDQTALNKLAVRKRLCPGRYNEQRRLHEDTMLQHFTTSFRFWPWLHTVTVKPWQVDAVHEKLKIYEYDEILEEYQRLRAEMN